MAGTGKKPAVAVVGTGHWGRNLVRNFRALDALATVWDTDESHRIDVARSAGVPAAGSFGEILADGSIPAVALATPAATHATLARAAIEAGKHVFVEKPLALTLAEGEEVVALARDHGCTLMVGHLLWYHPAVLRLKELVASGELGKIRYLYSHRLNLGRFRREENILWSFAPHDISVILGLVGEEPTRIHVEGASHLRSGIADVTTTSLDFRGGTRAHIFVSWLHPYKEQRLIVVGDRKMAAFDDLEPEEKLRLYPHTIEWDGDLPVPKTREFEALPVDPTEPLRAECAHFLDCIESRRTPRTDGEEALRVLRVLEAAQRQLGPLEVAAMPGARIHPTAVVDDGATIDEGTHVWHFTHVMPDARIGRDCVLGQNVFVGRGVRIGARVKIQNGVSVYEGVTLEDDVFCGPSMVFTNVTNPRAEIERKGEFRPTLVRRGATLGANATILCGTTIGRYAFVGAGAVVTKDVPDHALVTGNPARVTGWRCACGGDLTDLAVACRACGRRYQEAANGLAEIAPG